MTKKLFAVIIAALICVSFVFSASASTHQHTDGYLENGNSGEYVNNSEPINADEADEAEAEPGSEKDGVAFFWLPVSLLIGLLVGFLIINGIASKNKSVKMQKNATVYTRPGSMVITGSADNFLYNNVERRAKPKQTENMQN